MWMPVSTASNVDYCECCWIKKATATFRIAERIQIITSLAEEHAHLVIMTELNSCRSIQAKPRTVRETRSVENYNEITFVCRGLRSSCFRYRFQHNQKTPCLLWSLLGAIALCVYTSKYQYVQNAMRVWCRIGSYYEVEWHSRVER